MGKKKRREINPKSQEGLQAIGSGNALTPAFVESFQLLLDNKSLMFQVLEEFPFPIEIFDAAGTSVFFNRAGMQLNGIEDAGLVVGKYNLVSDPVCNDQLGMRESIQRAFRGEAVTVPDFPAPIEDLVARGVIKEKPYEKAIMDLYMFPVKDGGRLTFVVCIFLVKSVYHGKPEIAKAKEYLQNHWREEYDPNALAKAVNVSRSRLYIVFKQHTGMTPGDYHKKCKVERIKEKLADRSLAISDAFEACGESSRGWMRKVFKEATGLSPREYRDSLK